MDDLSELVTRAQGGELPAFGELVTRYQRAALAQAYASLGDFHLAQDVVQEAFLDAYRSLPGLRVPAAFVSWLRTIVHKHVDRQTRGGRPGLAPLGADLALPADADPALRAERSEAEGLIRAAATSTTPRAAPSPAAAPTSRPPAACWRRGSRWWTCSRPSRATAGARRRQGRESIKKGRPQ